MKDMTEEFQKWEASSSQEHVKNMIRIIKEIWEIAQSTRKCVFACNMVDGVKCLNVFDRKGGGMEICMEIVKRRWRNIGEA